MFSGLLHVQYRLFLPDFNKTFHDSLSKNTQIPNFMKIHPVGTELLHADGRTDGQASVTRLTVAFRNFANAPKNTPVLLHHSYLEQGKFLPQRDAVNISVTGIGDNYQTLFHFSCSVQILVQQDTTHYTHTHIKYDRRYCGNPQLTNSKHNLYADSL